MPSPLVTGGCFALKSKLDDKYLRYSPEKGKILEVSGEDVLNPYTRFCAELSKEHDGLVHIRCCYNNKYWVAREVKSEWCLMGDANEPQEDLADPSCTLLRHEPSSDHIDNVKLQHVSLKTSVYMIADAHPTEKSTIIRAGSLLLGNQPDEDAYSTFSVIDLEGQMLLPKHVCFKGDNGKYLFAWVTFLEFLADDIGDPLVRNIIETNSDGTIRIRSEPYDTFWTRSISSNAIAPLPIGNASDADSVFRALLLDRGGKCALQNLGNNNFCKRDLSTPLMYAAVPTITREAQLELHETVLSRRIYSVEYHLDDVNISGLKPRDYFIKRIDNTTDRPEKSKMAVEYDVTTKTRWDSSVSLKLGVTTTIEAGVPLVTEASVEISAEFSGSYSWGETKSKTKKYSSEEEVEVAPHTELTLRVVATEGTCDIPFTYTQEDILTTGETIVTHLGDGIYRGVNSYGFKTLITEKKIEAR